MRNYEVQLFGCIHIMFRLSCYKSFVHYVILGFNMAHRCSVNSSPVELSEFVKVLSQESNWYMLGVHLGVPSCKLDVIERAHTKDFSRCLVELHKSLGKNSLTWEVIASALEKMQNNNLADKIRTEYCVPSTAPLETMNTETTPPSGYKLGFTCI